MVVDFALDPVCLYLLVQAWFANAVLSGAAALEGATVDGDPPFTTAEYVNAKDTVGYTPLHIAVKVRMRRMGAFLCQWCGCGFARVYASESFRVLLIVVLCSYSLSAPLMHCADFCVCQCADVCVFVFVCAFALPPRVAVMTWLPCWHRPPRWVW